MRNVKGVLKLVVLVAIFGNDSLVFIETTTDCWYTIDSTMYCSSEVTNVIWDCLASLVRIKVCDFYVRFRFVWIGCPTDCKNFGYL